MEVFKGNDNNINEHTTVPTITEDIQISRQEVEESFKALENRKSPSQDGIPNDCYSMEEAFSNSTYKIT